jgi:hypothetical protein
MSQGDAILDVDRVKLLRSSNPDLRAVVQYLQGEEKAYFSDLLWIAEATLAVCDEA